MDLTLISESAEKDNKSKNQSHHWKNPQPRSELCTFPLDNWDAGLLQVSAQCKNQLLKHIYEVNDKQTLLILKFVTRGTTVRFEAAESSDKDMVCELLKDNVITVDAL